MSQAPRHPLLDLPRGATLRIDDGEPHVIDVFEGQVWLTLDGDPRDVILEGRESYRADREEAMHVFALRDCVLEIEFEDDVTEH